MQDYDRVRDLIERIIPGFGEAQPSGFASNGPKASRPTPFLHPIPRIHLDENQYLMAIRKPVQYDGLWL